MVSFFVGNGSFLLLIGEGSKRVLCGTRGSALRRVYFREGLKWVRTWSASVFFEKGEEGTKLYYRFEFSDSLVFGKFFTSHFAPYN